MKKIFRMALVFALAGATLMYTGCTKDYDEDINAANQKIESLVAQHAADVAALKNDLSAAVSNLEAAYKKADDAVTAAYKAADADLKNAIDANKDAIDANKAAIDANKDAIRDANVAIEAIEEELKTFATEEELAAAEEALEAKIGAIAEDLAGVKANLDKVAEDLGKQISDLDAKFTTALAEQKADLEGQIAEALEAAKTDLVSAKAELEAALALLGNELRSIVVDPDLYYAGVEAYNYTWTSIRPLDMYPATGDHEFKGENGENVTFKKDAEIYAVPAAKLDPYTLSQLATANYSLNPSSFDVNKAEWALTGRDYEYLVRADEKKAWKPEFVKWDNGAVRYTIANPELLPTTVYASKNGMPSLFDGYLDNTKDQMKALLADAGLDAQKYQWITLADILNWLYGNETQPEINQKFNDNFDAIAKDIEALKNGIVAANADIQSLYAEVDNLYQIWKGQQMQIASLYFLSSLNYKGVGYIPTMRLSAKLGEAKEKEVVSYDAAIVSDPEFFAALAFNSKSEYKANAFCKAGSHLYLSAPEAVQNAASVPVAYDKTLDLNFVNIHMFDAYKGEFETTLAELKKVYEGLDIQFSLVDYYDGDNKTEESMYGRIDVNDVFHPMCVIGGKQTEPKDAPNGGISSVGRKPVVLVKLINNVETEDGVREDVVLAGYFKIEIVKDISTDSIDFPAFDEIPFYCNTQVLSTSWDQFSDLVVEYLGTTYKQFVRDYKLDSKWYGEKSDIDQGDYDRAVVYELDENNNYVDTYDATKGDYKYANIYYFADGYGDGVNDIFEVYVTYDQLKAIGAGNSKTLYIKFSEDLYNVVYISFTIKVAETAKFDFGANKIKNEWYDQIDPEVFNTVLLNIVVPEKENDYIYMHPYSRDLDHYFVGYEPSKVLTADSPEVYLDEKLYDEDGNPVYGFAPRYEYLFNEVQSCKAFKFVASEDGKNLYLNEVKDENLIAYISYRTLVYANNEVSRAVLNKFAHDETDPEKMVWADIHVNVTYGLCDIEAGSADFHARFLRPLNVKFADQDIKEESQVNGSNLYVKNFLSTIVDWNNQDVVVKDKKGNLVENVIKEKVNMYKYYFFSGLYIDLDHATRNNWNVADPDEFGIMKDKTPEAKLTFGTADDHDYFTPSYSVPFKYWNYGIYNLADLDGYVINYKNDSANVEEFTIKIPVKVYYYWGTIEEEITVNVKKTTETEPGK